MRVLIDNGDIYEVQQDCLDKDKWVIITHNEFYNMTIKKSDCTLISDDKE